MNFTRRTMMLSSALAIFGSTALHAASASVAAVERYHSQLVAAMQGGGGSVQSRYQRLAPIMRSAFDFGSMVRQAAGPAWQGASGAQKAQLEQQFARFLAAYYASRFDGFSGESFQVDPTAESRGGGELVKARLVRPGGGAIAINYLMRGSRIVDLYLNGTISEVASRRAEFESVIRSGGVEALIAALRDRGDKLLAG